MKLKLGEIQDMKDPLGRLTNEQLPMKIAFKLNKLVRSFDENLQAIEEERVKLVKSLGKMDDNGSLQVPKENMEEFQKQYVELMVEEVEVSFEPFDLEDFSNAKITTQDMLKLDKLFKE